MATIKLEHVSVSFPVYASASRSIKNRLIRSATGGQIHLGSGAHRITVVDALQDINLDLKTGDRIGLVGHNGAGKTTLLRVLAKIYEPNEGRISIIGKTAPLFDINLGMDPESTGYENIMLRGLYLGLTRKQIAAHIDDIADFTELGDFLNLPIRTYSAGMQMRLAFAISTAVPPDILLLDEGIGAGDAAFLHKANERLKLFTEQVSIIVLSSHSEFLIRQMCNKALLMEHGRVIGSGSTEEVLQQYHLTLNPFGEHAAPLDNLVGYENLQQNEKKLASVHSGIVIDNDDDGGRWAAQTALLLREKRWHEVDIDRIIFELDQVAISKLSSSKNQFLSSDKVDMSDLVLDLVKSLLLWHFLIEKRTASNLVEINQKRTKILNAIEDNPSIFHYLSHTMKNTYPIAIEEVIRYPGIDSTDISRTCPVDLQTLLNKKWFPD